MKRLLLLYPRAWRERYQAEMEAVLDGVPFDPRAALDLVACAVDAHLHPPGGRRRAPLPLVAQVALLVVASLVALPMLRRLVEAPVLAMPGVAAVDPFIPAAIPALTALASWRAGWRLGTWFCGLLAAAVAVPSGSDWLWVLMSRGQSALGPVWFRLDGPYAAILVVLGVALVALLLRRAGTRWPVGLGIGVLLVTSTAVVPLALYLRPGSFIGWAWFISYVQWAAWAALTAAFLRRGGLAWWAALAAGTILGVLLSDAWLGPGSPWPLPGVLWAAPLAALLCRGGGGAPARGPVPA
jgi:hypothetical protein